MQGLGVRVQGLGVRVQGLGVRVQGLGDVLIAGVATNVGHQWLLLVLCWLRVLTWSSLRPRLVLTCLGPLVW